MIGVVAQAPDRFAAPSTTILLLTIAAIAFAISIHCYYWARVHQSTSSRPLPPGSALTAAGDELGRDHFAHLAWARRLHICFQAGILLLFVGLASAIWPVPGEPDPEARIAAVSCCGAMVLLVLLWTFGFFYVRLVAAAERGAVAPRLILWWFRPGHRAYEAHRQRTRSAAGSTWSLITSPEETER